MSLMFKLKQPCDLNQPSRDSHIRKTFSLCIREYLQNMKQADILSKTKYHPTLSINQIIVGGYIGGIVAVADNSRTATC